MQDKPIKLMFLGFIFEMVFTNSIELTLRCELLSSGSVKELQITNFD